MKALVVVISALGIAAARPALAQPRASAALAPVQVDEKANGRTITLRRGQELVVSVEACVGCPYGWSVARQPQALTALAAQEVDDTPRGGAQPIVGAKTIKYRFRAARAGRGSLQLAYRPFTGGNRGGRTLRINIVSR
jgi:predicted secreted protein